MECNVENKIEKKEMTKEEFAIFWKQYFDILSLAGLRGYKLKLQNYMMQFFKPGRDIITMRFYCNYPQRIKDEEFEFVKEVMINSMIETYIVAEGEHLKEASRFRKLITQLENIHIDENGK